MNTFREPSRTLTKEEDRKRSNCNGDASPRPDFADITG